MRHLSMHLKLLAVIAAVGMTSFAQADKPTASAGASASTPRLGAPLVCPDKIMATQAAMDAAFARRSIRVTGVHVALARSEMATSGLAAPAPASPESLARAAQASWLLSHGHVVAAKLINDASMGMPGYKPFGTALEMHLTVLTQPVNHKEAPEEAGSSHGAHAGHDHDDGIEEASAALNEIIRRAGVSAQALGPEYQKPQVRMYLLAHGFRDEIALDVAAHGLCQLKLPQHTITKIDVSARFMAMPGKPKAAAAHKR